MSGRATLAIIWWQFRRDFAVLAALPLLLGIAAGALQMRASLATPEVAALLPAVLAAVVVSVLVAQSPREIAAMTSLRLFAAPLYGRELARAQAVLPALAVLCFPLGLLAVHWRSEAGVPGMAAALAFGQVAAVLVALSGCFRRGRDRALYAALAALAGAAIALVGVPGGPIALGGAAVAAGVIGFAALRALGETLARFDPID